MRITITLLSLFISCSVFSQTINFPDSDLKDKLVNHIPVIDTNNDGDIQVSEAQSFSGNLNLEVDYSSVPYIQISNITGLENFENIKFLDLDYNNISTSIDFSVMQQLDSLSLKMNDLDEITLTNQQNIKKIDLKGNSISVYNLANLPSLKELVLESNNLMSIPSSLLNLSGLEALNLSYNVLQNNSINQLSQITSLKKLDLSNNTNIDNLDLTGLSNLEYFYSNESYATSINFAGLSNLKEIDMVFDGPINSANFTGLTNLEKVEIFGAPGQGPTLDLDFSSSSNVKKIKLAFFGITNINLGNSPDLEYLDLTGNFITSVNLSQFTGLIYLDLSFNNLSTLDVSSNINLLTILIPNNNINNINVSNLSELKNLFISNNPLDTLDVSNNPELIYVSILNLPELTYANLKNGSNENLESEINGVPVLLFDNMPNLEKVCVDDPSTFTTTLYNEAELGPVDFIVTSNCNLSSESFQLSKIKVYPNPTTDKVFIDGNIQFKEISVVDVNGKNLKVKYDNNSVDFSHLSKGIYFVKISSSTSETITEKVVKK